MSGEYVFTSESVTEGHPDKMCDQISDAVLDATVRREAELAAEGFVSPVGTVASPEYVRVACETLVTTGLVVVAGEIRTHAYVDIPGIVRDTIEILSRPGFVAFQRGEEARFDERAEGAFIDFADQQPGRDLEQLRPGLVQTFWMRHTLSNQFWPPIKGAGSIGIASLV